MSTKKPITVPPGTTYEEHPAEWLEPNPQHEARGAYVRIPLAEYQAMQRELAFRRAGAQELAKQIDAILAACEKLRAMRADGSGK